MAIQWLELTKGAALTGSAAGKSWRIWANEVQHPNNYDRRPLSDSAVLDFVRQLNTREPGISKTRALRCLRDSGLACEQRRFGALFVQAGFGS
jgi:hypothetical protein